MWNFFILAILAALTGFYSLLGNTRGISVTGLPPAMPIAESMAQYRNAVVAYYAAHPEDAGTSVSLNTLTDNKALPAWSTIGKGAPVNWANYHDASGRITIYAAPPLPPVSITSELLQLSHNSVLVGEYRGGTLYSPVVGATAIPLPTPAQAAIPAGSPVWVAMGP